MTSHPHLQVRGTACRANPRLAAPSAPAPSSRFSPLSFSSRRPPSPSPAASTSAMRAWPLPTPAIPQQRRRRQHRGHELCTAVLHFQTAQGLNATGCTGPLTRARINTIEAQRPEWVTTLSKENVRTNVSGAQVPGYGLQPPPAVHVRTMMALNNRFNERSVGHRVGNRCAVPDEIAYQWRRP